MFVAGQMPNNEAMTALEPAAYRAPNAVWNGTDIRLQSEFIIAGRLKPALEAGGSSLANAIKAQVYLTDINDLPEFMDVWNAHFAANPCALTVVATKGLALLESEDRDQHLRRARWGRSARRSSSTSRRRRCGSGLRRARGRALVPFRALCRRRERRAAWRAIRPALFRRARAAPDARGARRCRRDCACRRQFARQRRARAPFRRRPDLAYPALQVWNERLAGAPIPFGVVRMPAPMPIPGCDVIVDTWVYCRGS